MTLIPTLLAVILVLVLMLVGCAIELAGRKDKTAAVQKAYDICRRDRDAACERFDALLDHLDVLVEMGEHREVPCVVL